jgi:hypothetical protein
MAVILFCIILLYGSGNNIFLSNKVYSKTHLIHVLHQRRVLNKVFIIYIIYLTNRQSAFVPRDRPIYSRIVLKQLLSY